MERKVDGEAKEFAELRQAIFELLDTIDENRKQCRIIKMTVKTEVKKKRKKRKSGIRLI